MYRDFLKDMIKYLPSLAVPALVGVIGLPIYTRLFTPEDYGNYSLVMATVTIMSIIVGWLGMATIRFYPLYEQKKQIVQLRDNVIILLFASLITLSGFYMGILYLVRNNISSRLRNLLTIGCLMFIIMASFEVFQQFLRAKRWAGLYSLFHIWNSIAGLGFGLALVACFNLNVEGLLWGHVLGMSLAFPLLFRYAIRGFPDLRSLSSGLAREMAKYGFPLVMGNMAAWMLSLSDRYIIEYLRNSREVGIYSAGYTLSEKSIIFITNLIMLAAGPLSVRIWEIGGEGNARKFTTIVTRYYLLLAVPTVVGVSVLARPIMEIMVGPSYREGYKVIPLVAFGGFFFGLQQRFQAGHIFYNKTYYVMASIFVAGLFNFMLNLLFIGKYGYMAAALTTLCGYFVLLFLMIITSRKYFKWRFPFTTLVRAVTASSIMGLVIYPFGYVLHLAVALKLAIGSILGIFFYVVFLLLVGEFNAREKVYIWSLIKRRRFKPYYIPKRQD